MAACQKPALPAMIFNIWFREASTTPFISESRNNVSNLNSLAAIAPSKSKSFCCFSIVGCVIVEVRNAPNP